MFLVFHFTRHVVSPFPFWLPSIYWKKIKKTRLSVGWTESPRLTFPRPLYQNHPHRLQKPSAPSASFFLSFFLKLLIFFFFFFFFCISRLFPYWWIIYLLEYNYSLIFAPKNKKKMNDLFSGSFSRFRSEQASPDHPHHHTTIQMTENPNSTGGVNLDKFFDDVESVKDELKELERLHNSLQTSHEKSKTLHNAKAVKDLRSRMDADVSAALKNAKLIKIRLEALDRSNAANRSLPGCGPGSSSDRTRTSVVNGLRKKLKDSMESFNELRQRISSEYRDTVQRRYYTVTGENPDEKTLDRLISTGEWR